MDLKKIKKTLPKKLLLCKSFLGRIRGLYTKRKTETLLLQLANLQHPLLKRLRKEATGTYCHSLLVSNLAEIAAGEIGANILVAKVGGFYHDIGKLNKGNYFKENQKTWDIHETFSPLESAETILKHVPDGVQLAKEYQLPQEIRAIIEQHQGTGCVQSFYMKALEKDPSTSKADFTYCGPIPQTKEAGLILLADSSEAAIRSKQEQIRKTITVEQVIRNVVEQKKRENQLSETSLTDSEIEKVIEIYSRILEGMYHQRSEYPTTKPFD